ncbi:hypothetical protein Vi05172_g7575 [Venturia inaequalis]|nr:hypothetical protein Vi05172_g7575 [Venturia inaequalis]
MLIHYQTKSATMVEGQGSKTVNVLTVPRELKQKILHESFEHALEQDTGFSTNHAILHLSPQQPSEYLRPNCLCSPY